MIALRHSPFSTMEDKPQKSTLTNMERPGGRDILFGRGNVVFNHLGNRRFRQLVDLFIEDYCDPRTQRGEKTMLVRNVVETVHDNGYRFLKPDNEGVFAELGMKFVLKKVGHALRDRSPNVDLHLQRNLKTRRQLAEEGLDIVQYAESVTGGGDHDHWRVERYYNTKTSVSGRQLWVRPRGHKPESNPEAELAASSLLQMLSSTTKKPPKKKKEKGAVVKKEKKVKPQKKHEGALGSNKKPVGRYMKSINDIVVPTLQSASAELPIGGNWKFFPLPGLKNEVDLGTTLKGWTLRLEPMGFEAEAISLNVPMGY